MSLFWSLWIMFLVVLNLSITFLLYLWAPRAKIPMREDGTSGHVWAHGVLREGVRRLPTWWVVMSGSMFVIGFIYLALFPGFGAFKGLLHWTSHGELAEHTAANDAKLGELMKRLSLYPIEQLANDPEAQQLGKRLFQDDCAACHGRAGKGNQLLGAPDLTDNDWLYGGDGKDIYTSIHDGRSGVMPPWASLGEDNVKNLAQYVLSLSGRPHDEKAAEAAKPLFATCAACHGPDGKGNTALGAPNLTDQIWLHGGTVNDIETTIRGGRQGHMPAWSPRLTDDQIRIVASYVYHISHTDHAPSP
jgi:cytochrome c oxidase cbb3-type subunit 3